VISFGAGLALLLVFTRILGPYAESTDFGRFLFSVGFPRHYRWLGHDDRPDAKAPDHAVPCANHRDGNPNFLGRQNELDVRISRKSTMAKCSLANRGIRQFGQNSKSPEKANEKRTLVTSPAYNNHPPFLNGDSGSIAAETNETVARVHFSSGHCATCRSIAHALFRGNAALGYPLRWPFR